MDQPDCRRAQSVWQWTDAATPTPQLWLTDLARPRLQPTPSTNSIQCTIPWKPLSGGQIDGAVRQLDKWQTMNVKDRLHTTRIVIRINPACSIAPNKIVLIAWLWVFNFSLISARTIDTLVGVLWFWFHFGRVLCAYVAPHYNGFLVAPDSEYRLNDDISRLPVSHE